MPPKKLTPNGQAAEPVGAKIAATRKPAAKPKATPKRSTSSNKYVRNVRGVNVRVTFDTGRKIELAPRGQRNDMTAISKDELDDPIFLNNLGSLYEVISAADAQEIREKQMTNASTLSQPRPEDILTDQLGNAGNFTGLDASNTEKSITIGHLNEVEGRPNEERATEITRSSVGPRVAVVPGSDAKNIYD
jgi:hypothetical protein